MLSFYKSRMGSEQVIPRCIQHSQSMNKKEAFMEFYDVGQPLYLEIYTPGLKLGVGLPQIRGRMNCAHDKTTGQNNTMTHGIYQ